MNILPHQKQIEVMDALRKGASIRATARLTGVNRGTVGRLAQKLHNSPHQAPDLSPDSQSPLGADLSFASPEGKHRVVWLDKSGQAADSHPDLASIRQGIKAQLNEMFALTGRNAVPLPVAFWVGVIEDALDNIAKGRDVALRKESLPSQLQGFTANMLWWRRSYESGTLSERWFSRPA